MKRTGLLAVSIIVAVGTYSLPVAYAEDVTAQDRISTLEQRVKELEQRLGHHDGAEPIAPPTVNTMPAMIKKNQGWTGLRTGMTKPEVADLLGNPNKMEVHGDWELVRYSFPQGGSVVFDSHGFLSSWHAPDKKLSTPPILKPSASIEKLDVPPVREPDTVPKALPTPRKEVKSWSTVPQDKKLLWDIPPQYEHLPTRGGKLTRRGMKSQRTNSWDVP